MILLSDNGLAQIQSAAGSIVNSSESVSSRIDLRPVIGHNHGLTALSSHGWWSNGHPGSIWALVGQLIKLSEWALAQFNSRYQVN